MENMELGNYYGVGDILENFIGTPDGVRMDITDCGLDCAVYMNNPTEKELEQFRAGNSFDIRFTVIRDVIMFALKIGSLNWMDAPYDIHLSQNYTMFDVPGDNQHVVLTLMLIDSSNGEIKHIRLLSLSPFFTKKLFLAIMEQNDKYFSKDDYDMRVQSIFDRYSTKEIVKMSSVYSRNF